MNIPLFFGLVVLLGSIYIWIGKCASKGLQTTEDYFLMGRKLTFFPLSLTLLATQLGGGTFLGAAQEAYQRGWLVLFYPLGASLGFFILGMGFGGKLRKLDISTVAEIFEKIYRSKPQRYIASLLSIVTLLFTLVGQGIAARLLFFAMGAEEPIIFIIFWSVLVLYTVLGGLKAVVNTDILQALFIIATSCMVFFFIDPSKISIANTLSPREITPISEIPWVTWCFMPLLFILIGQDMGQRCFATKNPRIIFFSAIVAGIVLLCCSSVAIYFGVLAKEAGIQIPASTSILIASVAAFTNPIVCTFFTVAIFVAVISTADSLLCAISSNLSCDFLATLQICQKKQLRISQLLTLITGLFSLGIAFLFDNVITMLMISYEFFVCILFAPIFLAVISKHPSRIGASFSMVCGATGFILFRILDLPLPKEVLTILLSFVGYFLGKKLSDKKKIIGIAKGLER